MSAGQVQQPLVAGWRRRDAGIGVAGRLIDHRGAVRTAVGAHAVTTAASTTAGTLVMSAMPSLLSRSHRWATCLRAARWEPRQ